MSRASLRIVGGGCILGSIATHMYSSTFETRAQVGDAVTKRDEVCVLGGGITGVLQAYELSKRGYKVTVLDASPRPETLLTPQVLTTSAARAHPRNTFTMTALPVTPCRYSFWRAIFPPNGAYDGFDLCLTTGDLLLGGCWWMHALCSIPEVTAGVLKQWPETLSRLCSEIPEVASTVQGVQNINFTRLGKRPEGYNEAEPPSGVEQKAVGPLSWTEVEAMEPILQAVSQYGGELESSRGWVKGEASCVTAFLDTARLWAVLRAKCVANGVVFLNGVHITSLTEESHEGGPTEYVLAGDTKQSEYRFDSVVLCCGASARRVTFGAARRASVFPAKTQAIVTNVKAVETPPQDLSSFYDADCLVQTARSGDNIVVRGQLDLGNDGRNPLPRESMVVQLRTYAHGLMGIKENTVLVPRGEECAVSPDYNPIIGRVFGKVFVNTGFIEKGSSGMAATSMLADMMQDPTLAETNETLARLTPERFHTWWMNLL